MPAPAIVLIIMIVSAVLLIGGYLILIGIILRNISVSMAEIIEVAGKLPGKTAPLTPVLSAINKDLSIARGVLENLLLKKLGPAKTGAAMSVARSGGGPQPSFMETPDDLFTEPATPAPRGGGGTIRVKRG